MERAHLLEELAHLKRILKKHEQSCSVSTKKLQDTGTSNDKSSSFSGRTLVLPSNEEKGLGKHKNKVFVNPKKFNALPTHKQTKVLEKNNQDPLLRCIKNVNNGVSKVYINPNFTKSITLPDSHTYPTASNNSKMNNVIKKARSKQPKFVGRSFEESKSIQKEYQCGQYQRNKESSNQPFLNQQSSQSSLIVSNNQKIFVNPQFSRVNKIKSVSHPLTHESMEGIVKRLETRDVESNLKPNSFKLSSITKNVSDISTNSCGSSDLRTNNTPLINFNKKENICLKQYNVDEVLTSQHKIKLLDHGSKNVTKVFLNPKFECGLQESKTVGITDLISQDANITPEMSSAHSNTIMEENKLKGRVDQSSFKSATFLSLPKECQNRSDPLKEPAKKDTCKRKRNHNTCLVALSSTKLISKKRSRQNSTGQNLKANLNLPVFLSKTKLVRHAPSIQAGNSGSVIKPKVKRVIPKINLQCLTPDKINKLKKQSFAHAITNLVNTKPKSPAITKIKSKNGKSLKLIRINTETNKPNVESNSFKSVNIMHKRTNILKQQVSKSALCIVQNKFMKSQFSKVNVPTKKKINQSFNYNKYVYKNKDSVRKILTRASVFDKKRKLNLTKAQGSGNVSEKKFLGSKYKLIRKKLSNLDNTLTTPCKDNKPKKVTTNPSKRKWKMGNGNLKRKERSIVNIGGVFYRCSRTSLCKNKSSSKGVSQKQNKGPFLHINGQKFQFENNGLTLTCLDKKPTRKRIDIGGVTFISSSSGTSLTRTNYHTARSILVQAKQKSISMLTRKMRKNNEPCLFFHRLGRCNGKQRGTCDRRHDAKYVAVCKRFVQGSCEDSQCLLSHNISCHNMPTCQHFLAGHCGRDNCPFLHVKVSDSAPICLDLLKGYCPLGDQCSKRHLEMCPSFEKGTCSRGKYCPYPHPKSKSNQKLKGKFKFLEKTVQPLKAVELVSSSSIRYFEDLNLQKENQIQLKEDSAKLEDCDASEEDGEGSQPLKKRPRLGSLPSFIPLSFDNS